MPVMHIVAGPNGAGKSSFVGDVLGPVTGLPFINADIIAAEHWPGASDAMVHAYEAAVMADAEREVKLARHRSFITETVFSHPSKLDLVDRAVSRNYFSTLYVVMVPLEVAMQRVVFRVAEGGHDVPRDKIAERYHRLWDLVAVAKGRVGRAIFLDDSLAAHPFRPVATYENGRLREPARWPAWTPPALLAGEGA